MSGWGTSWDSIAKGFTAKPEWLNDVTDIKKANKVPTHDPYTNPNAELYYSCECGQILDPGTKSFAALNNAASEAGWKIRFGEQHYIPYCVECGKDVE